MFRYQAVQLALAQSNGDLFGVFDSRVRAPLLCTTRGVVQVVRYSQRVLYCTANSNTNRVLGTICPANAVSCVEFRPATLLCPYARSPSCPVLTARVVLPGVCELRAVAVLLLDRLLHVDSALHHHLLQGLSAYTFPAQCPALTMQSATPGTDPTHSTALRDARY